MKKASQKRSGCNPLAAQPCWGCATKGGLLVKTRTVGKPTRSNEQKATLKPVCATFQKVGPGRSAEDTRRIITHWERSTRHAISVGQVAPVDAQRVGTPYDRIQLCRLSSLERVPYRHISGDDVAKGAVSVNSTLRPGSYEVVSQ